MPAAGIKVTPEYGPLKPAYRILPVTRIWYLAGPLILSNLSIALLGLVDTAVVGHLQHAYYIGAVAVGSVVFDFLYWGLGFLRMGTTGVVAQCFGERNHTRSRTALAQAVVMALFLSLLILFLQRPVINTALDLIGGSSEVQRYADTYISWAIWGAPAVLVNLSLIGWLLGMHNARATLTVTVVINALNIILDFIFVFGFNMDVRGVALATVISQYAGLFIAAGYIMTELSRHSGNWQKEMILAWREYLPIISLNRNIFIRTLCLIFVFAFFTREGARQSDTILAANTVLLKFQMLIALGLDGFANAAEVLVGKAIGEQDRHEFSEAVIAAFSWSVVLALGYSLVFWMGGELLIRLMTNIDNVQLAAASYLGWIIISPLVSVWCFVLDGIFIGATRGVELRNSMMASTAIIFLPAWYVLQPLNNHGLWLALMLFFIARGLTLGWYFYRIRKSATGFMPFYP